MVADEERDEHRQPGDGDVVVDLADRPGEGPAVGEVHEAAVDGVEQAHARRRTGSAATRSRRTAARSPPPCPTSTSSATSVAVSKPSPKSNPIGYIFQGVSIRRASGPKNRFISPRLLSCASSSASSYLPLTHLPEDLDDPDQDDDVQRGDQVQEEARDRRADDVGDVVQPGAAVLHLVVQRADAEVQQHRHARTRSWSGRGRRRTRRYSGRLPSLTSLRVVLSIAAMWSASNACRMPRV